MHFFEKFSEQLEHTLDKNGSTGPAIMWQNQIQTIEYGINDTIRIKKIGTIMIIHSLNPLHGAVV